MTNALHVVTYSAFGVCQVCVFLRVIEVSFVSSIENTTDRGRRPRVVSWTSAALAVAEGIEPSTYRFEATAHASFVDFEGRGKKSTCCASIVTSSPKGRRCRGGFGASSCSACAPSLREGMG